MTGNNGDSLFLRAPREIRRYRRRPDISFERYKRLPHAEQKIAKAIVRSWRLGLDMTSLAQRLGVKLYPVSGIRNSLGLPNREEWLQRKVHMFILRGFTRHAISVQLGISLTKADRLRQKLGIPSTPHWRSLAVTMPNPVQLRLFE